MNLMPTIQPGDTITEIWWKGRIGMEASRKEAWDSMWTAGLWALWKERNRWTFSDKTKPESLAMDVHNWVVFG